MAFESQAYGPVFGELISERRLNPLDGGVVNSQMAARLEALTGPNAFAGHRVVDQTMADACISAVWLYHNFLDRSHTISQGILSQTGSYWHGIMHRREPDFSNSKYWFRKVGDHPLFEDLNKEASAAAQEVEHAPNFLTTQKAWDPAAFIDLCAGALSGKSPVDALCREIQQREWELLFDYSYRHALGK
ncbi:MAG: hypothetical protein O3B73_00870 [bacterium]|jgi:hypothetical protein|nr:hypothetical protein [bacterium]